VGEKVAQVIIAETGGDMTRFPTAAHLAAWAGLAPAMNESAGKQSPAGKRHGNKWLTAMLVEAAGSVGRMHGKNYLAAQHARLMKRRGMGRAQVAVAHSIGKERPHAVAWGGLCSVAASCKEFRTQFRELDQLLLVV
jgi:transposase